MKASVLVGLYLGWLRASAFVAGILAGFMLAAIAGLVMIISGWATCKGHLAFGPYMFCGAAGAIPGQSTALEARPAYGMDVPHFGRWPSPGAVPYRLPPGAVDLFRGSVTAVGDPAGHLL